MIAMILAAGRGERLRPLSDTLPKALMEVAGRSLIERHLDKLADAGFETAVVNLGWLGELISERIGSGSRYGLTVIYSQEGENVLETGGGIRRALPVLGDKPFLVVNADIFTDMPFDLQLDEDALAHLVLVPTPTHKKRGDFAVTDGKIAIEVTPTHTFSGVAMYRPEFFAGVDAGRFPLAPMLRAGASEGEITGSIYSGLWEDVGTPERLAEINRQQQP